MHLGTVVFTNATSTISLLNVTICDHSYIAFSVNFFVIIPFMLPLPELCFIYFKYLQMLSVIKACIRWMWYTVGEWLWPVIVTLVWLMVLFCFYMENLKQSDTNCVSHFVLTFFSVAITPSQRIIMKRIFSKRPHCCVDLRYTDIKAVTHQIGND